MINRRRFFFWALGSLGVTLLPPATWAEAKKKRRKADPDNTPSPISVPAPEGATDRSSPAKTGGAHLRLWKATDAPTQALQIRLLDGKSNAGTAIPIKMEEGSYQFSTYVEVPAGYVTAEISAPGQPVLPIVLSLVDGGQSTLLVRRLAGTMNAEWIDDTLPPLEHGCEFNVYNLLSASGDIQISLGDAFSVHLGSVHSSLRLRGLKRSSYPVTINGTDGDGKNFRWTTDADFRQFRKATLLIYPDPYGRIRPRINAV